MKSTFIKLLNTMLQLNISSRAELNNKEFTTSIKLQLRLSLNSCNIKRENRKVYVTTCTS